MKYSDAWNELKKTVEILEQLYDNTTGFAQSLSVVKAIRKNMDHLEDKHE
jgi:hypothetical protein